MVVKSDAMEMYDVNMNYLRRKSHESVRSAGCMTGRTSQLVACRTLSTLSAWI